MKTKQVSTTAKTRRGALLMTMGALVLALSGPTLAPAQSLG